jgi:hypothetical protein
MSASDSLPVRALGKERAPELGQLAAALPPLDAALARENREFLPLFDSHDKTEGMRGLLRQTGTGIYRHVRL